jgi:hypothetical protein
MTTECLIISPLFSCGIGCWCLLYCSLEKFKNFIFISHLKEWLVAFFKFLCMHVFSISSVYFMLIISFPCFNLYDYITCEMDVWNFSDCFLLYYMNFIFPNCFVQTICALIQYLSLIRKLATSFLYHSNLVLYNFKIPSSMFA